MRKLLALFSFLLLPLPSVAQTNPNVIYSSGVVSSGVSLFPPQYYVVPVGYPPGSYLGGAKVPAQACSFSSSILQKGTAYQSIPNASYTTAYFQVYDYTDIIDYEFEDGGDLYPVYQMPTYGYSDSQPFGKFVFSTKTNSWSYAGVVSLSFAFFDSDPNTWDGGSNYGTGCPVLFYTPPIPVCSPGNLVNPNDMLCEENYHGDHMTINGQTYEYLP